MAYNLIATNNNQLVKLDKPHQSPSKNDPFGQQSKIPLLTSNYLDNASFIRKRNERERARVKSVNEGFDQLRKVLPLKSQRDKRISKVETLRLAINYIKHLRLLLGFDQYK